MYAKVGHASATPHSERTVDLPQICRAREVEQTTSPNVAPSTKLFSSPGFGLFRRHRSNARARKFRAFLGRSRAAGGRGRCLLFSSRAQFEARPSTHDDVW